MAGTLEFLASATHNTKAGLSQRDRLKHWHNQVLLQPCRRTYRSRLQPSTSELAPHPLKCPPRRTVCATKVQRGIGMLGYTLMFASLYPKCFSGRQFT
jgi:hypothetical protein